MDTVTAGHWPVQELAELPPGSGNYVEYTACSVCTTQTSCHGNTLPKPWAVAEQDGHVTEEEA